MEPQPDPARTIRDLELLVQQLEARVADLEAGKPLASSREAARRALKGYPAPTGAKAAGGGEKAYSEGMRLYQAKKYSEAREKFHQYLQGQPRGSKAPEARYHMADSFFQEGKYKEAGVEFNKLAVQFPKSILAPAALLRQAQAYKNLQQTANYRSILKKLEQTYPQSPEAREAQKWLKEK
jgi:tol-pal system protein YbgF